SMAKQTCRRRESSSRPELTGATPVFDRYADRVCVLPSVYALSRAQVYGQVRLDEWPQPPFIALGSSRQVTSRSGDLLGKDVRANQRQTGALAGKRRGTVGSVPGEHDPPIRPPPHTHLRHFASVEVFGPVEFRHQRSEAPPDISERGLQRALLSDGILQWRLRSPIGEVERHAKLIVGPVGIDDDAPLGGPEHQLPVVQPDPIRRRIDAGVDAERAEISVVWSERAAPHPRVETVRPDYKIEAPATAAFVPDIDPAIVLVQRRDLVAKHIGHTLAGRIEQDAGEIVPKELD